VCLDETPVFFKKKSPFTPVNQGVFLHNGTATRRFYVVLPAGMPAVHRVSWQRITAPAPKAFVIGITGIVILIKSDQKGIDIISRVNLIS